MLAILCGIIIIRYPADAAAKRALFYGPTSDAVNGVAEQFVTNSASGFAAISNTITSSQIWTESTWLNKSTADFAQFDVIIIGDQPTDTPDCGYCPEQDRAFWNTATANRAVWSAAVTGNVLILGTDPDCHANAGVAGATLLVQKAVTFGADQGGYAQHVTGLYVSLRQVGFGSFDGLQTYQSERIELLAGLGDFRAVTPQTTINDTSGNACAKVVSNPILDCLTDSDLGGWVRSAHQSFWSWPAGYLPVAIAQDVWNGSGTPGYVPPCESYQNPNGEVAVYILGRGAFNQLTSGPCVQAKHPGEFWTTTATLVTLPNGTPVPSRRVGFVVTSGPNAGVHSAASQLTDAGGHVNFTYQGATGTGTEGQDLITIYLDDNNNNQRDPCEGVTTNICNWGNTIVTITASDAAAKENQTPPDTGTYTISRGASSSSPLTLRFATGGNAGILSGLGNDYTLDSVSTEGV